MLTERFLWERPVTELILEKALHKAKIPFKSNVFIGRYEVDFLVCDRQHKIDPLGRQK